MTAIDKYYRGSFGYQAAENSVNDNIVAVLPIISGNVSPQGISHNITDIILMINSNSSRISSTQSIVVFGLFF